LLSGHSPVRFVANVAVWALLGSLCLCKDAAVAEVCVEQHDKKPSRPLWPTPAGRNDPIRWRECYVIGLAPLPIFRAIPRWLAVLGVFRGGRPSQWPDRLDVSPEFLSSVWRFDLAAAFAGLRSRANGYEAYRRSWASFFCAAGLPSLWVCVAGPACREKRLNTWDDFAADRSIVQGNHTGQDVGNLQATFPYVIA